MDKSISVPYYRRVSGMKWTWVISVLESLYCDLILEKCELILEKSWWSRSKRAAASPPPPYVFTEISFDALAPTAAADHVSLRPEPFRDQESLQSGPGEVPCEPHHLLFIVFLFRTFGPENCTNILFPVYWLKLYFFWKLTGKRIPEYTRIILRRVV